MLSFNEFETYLKPFCNKRLYDKKIKNYHEVQKSFKLRNEYCDGFPIHLHVEATSDCNLSCPLCPKGRNLIKRKENLSLSNFLKVFSQISSNLVYIVISGWGEPLLNLHTPKMINHANTNSVFVIMNTNGILLYEKTVELLKSNLNVLNISLDGAVSKSTHQYYSNSFSRVVAGVKRLVKMKISGHYKYPFIHGQFLLNEETIDEIEYLREWAIDLGIEHVRFKRKHETMPGQYIGKNSPTTEYPSSVFKHGLVKPTEITTFSPKVCTHP